MDKILGSVRLRLYFLEGSAKGNVEVQSGCALEWNPREEETT